MNRKCLQRFMLSFVTTVLAMVYLIPTVFCFSANAATIDENWLPPEYTYTNDELFEKALLRERIENIDQQQKDFNNLMSTYENMKKNKVKQTADILKESNKILNSAITAIKKMQTDDDFDHAALFNDILSAGSGIFNMIPGWGTIVGAGIDIFSTAFNAIMGGQDAPSVEALMQDRVNQRLDEIADQLSGIEEQIGELSNQINDQTNTILSKMSDSFDNAEAKAKLAEFMLCTGRDDFGYNQYRNSIYGLIKNNSSSSTAYYNLLLHAQTSGASTEVVKAYYDALYDVLCDNRDTFRDYVIGTESGKSIVQYYYDVVSARPDLLDDGTSPEMAAIRFAYDLYQTQLMADQLMLMCNNYQYVQMLLEGSDIYWFGSEATDFIWKSQIDGDDAVDAMYSMMSDREDEITKQFAKDLVYVLQVCKTYTIKKTNGEPYTLNSEIVDGATYAKALVGQTICLNRIPDYVCELFEIDSSDYEYEGEGVYCSDGLFTYSTNSNITISIKYKGKIIESLIFTDGASGEFFGGTGTPSDPYLISNAQQFLNINNGLDKYYKLIADIDFEKDGISQIYPIGWHRNSVGTDVYDAFEGVLNGNGYTVKNASIASGNYTALFGKIGESGAIRNVVFDSISIEATVDNVEKSVGSFYYGIIAATNDGLIKNCKVTNSTASVTGNTTNEGVNRTVDYKAGGIVGVNKGAIAFVEIENCVLSVNSTHDFAGASTKGNMNSVCVGGITGDNSGYIGYAVVNSDVEVTAKANSVCDQKTTVAPYVTGKVGGIAATNEASFDHFKAVYSDAIVLSKATADSKSGYVVYQKNIKKEQSKYVNGFGDSDLSTIREEKTEIISAFPVEAALNVDFIDNDVYSVCESQLHKDATLTINGVDTDYSVLAIYGFDTYNDSEKYTQTRNITLLLAVIIDENYTVLTVDSSITVGKDYVSSIEPSGFKTEYIKGEIIPNTINLLQYYASGEDKCIPVIDAKVSISDASITNTVGAHIITITYNGVSCEEEINVKCPYENFYENKEHYSKINTVTPTCQRIGYDEFECQECGEVIQTNFKAKTNHNYVKDVSRNATCKEEGLIGQVFCSMCNTVFESEVVIPKLSHDVVEIGDTTVPASQLPDSESHYCKSGNHRISHDYTVSESIINGVLTYTYTCKECKYVNTIVDTNIITNAEKMQPTVVVSDGYALKGGDIVTVYVSLINNPGVTGAHFGIRYDERLTFLDDWSEGTLFTQSLSSDSAPVSCGYNFIWGNSDTRSNDGTLLILKFRLPEDATKTDKFSVSVIYTSNNGTIEGFSIDSKVLNAYNLGKGTNLSNSDPIRFITKNGTIQLVDHLPGDVNSDGVVDILDALFLSHAVVYEEQTEEINKYGDINLSGGNANVNDVVDILKSLTGAYGTTLLYHEYELIVNTNGYVNISSTNFVQLHGENSTYDRILTDHINNLMKQREGYKFLGWFTRLENGAEIKLSDTIKYDPNQKIQTVYAHWEKNSVSFDMNDATSDKLEGITYGGSDRYITLTTPEEKYTITFADPQNSSTSTTREMIHEFSHWALLDENGGVIRIYNAGDKFDINEANLGNVTLKAVWAQNNGWTLAVPSLNKVGYDSTKIDWYSDVYCTNKVSVSAFESIKALSNKVLYANWTTPITYNVTYDLANGSTKTVTVTYGAYVQIPIPNFEGYTFQGWTITNAEGISSSDSTKVDFQNLRSTSGTVVMTAKKAINSYTVNINKNDGSGTITETSNYGATFTVNNPTRNGYIFAGWKITGMDGISHTYGSSTTSSNYLSGIKATTFKNLRGDNGKTVTFTAYWKVNTETIGKYVANGSVVCDTDEQNYYTVYKIVGQTPQLTLNSCRSKVIVDWSNYSGSIDYPYEVTHDSGKEVPRYGGGNTNLDIAYGITEVFFVGNPSATYTNVHIYTVGYPANATLTIHLKNMNFSSSSSIVNSWYGNDAQDIGMHLTIDCLGTNTITATAAGGTPILNRKNLTFSGNGTLSVKGGDGSDATSAGGNGTDGGTAIIADNVVIDMTGKITVTGGKGGNGANGADGSRPTDYDDCFGTRNAMGGGADGKNGGAGEAGGNGGKGGYAIVAKSVVSYKNAIKAIGGAGGSGGNGGNGGQGGVGQEAGGWGATAGNGGNGGNGGKGGNAYKGAVAVIGIDNTPAVVSNVTASAGANGTVGSGGNGGAAGAGGHHSANGGHGQWATWGNNGSSGKAGVKGADGTLLS